MGPRHGAWGGDLVGVAGCFGGVALQMAGELGWGAGAASGEPTAMRAAWRRGTAGGLLHLDDGDPKVA